MLSVEQAREKVLSAFRPTETVEVRLADALGAVTARDLVAPDPSPRFDNSAMDGYAVLSADVSGASEDLPVSLELRGEVRAGDGDLPEVVAGTAVRIMTGASLPFGADAVVPVEEADERGSKVLVRVAAEAGRHIRRAGEDLEAGDLLLAAGTQLRSGELGLLAAMGISPVPVHRRPRVAVLVTGDELVAVEQRPGPGQIRDSNSVALAALVTEAGAEVVLSERVPDDLDATVAALEAATAADLIVSSGGVAVGRYDFIKPAVEKLGRIDMWKVAMQPGKPVVLGDVSGVPFLGLPGNPVSIHVSFEQFVRPAIRKMLGYKQLSRPRVTARLTEAITKRPGRQHFVRIFLEHADDGWFATPTGPQGSHILSSLAGCDGVAIFPAEETHIEMGAEVEVEAWRFPGGGS